MSGDELHASLHGRLRVRAVMGLEVTGTGGDRVQCLYPCSSLVREQALRLEKIPLEFPFHPVRWGSSYSALPYLLAGFGGRGGKIGGRGGKRREGGKGGEKGQERGEEGWKGKGKERGKEK